MVLCDCEVVRPPRMGVWRSVSTAGGVLYARAETSAGTSTMRLWSADSWASTPAAQVRTSFCGVYGIMYVWRAGAIPTVGSFGSGTGPIFLNNLGCLGDEESLLDCLSSGIAMNCNHTRDVGVVCSGEWYESV